MKKSFVAFGLFVLALLNTGAAFAEVDVGGHVGTTGVGFHANFPINKHFNARVGLGYLDYNYSGSTRGLRYDLDLKAHSYDALLDWYPREDSSFRITGGLSYNGNKIGVRGRPNANGNYVIQGNTYDAASVGKVSGRVDFNKVAPYLGVGWGRPAAREKGWSFSADVGVLLQGAPKTSLSSSGCTASADRCNQFSADLARENRALRNDVDKFKFYPVLRVGVSYKF